MKGNENAFELKLNKLTEGANPVPQLWQELLVVFSAAMALLKDFNVFEYADICMLSRSKLQNVPFTERQFYAYLCWCIKQRIDWVTGKKPYWYPTDRRAFPAFISVICQNIGKVTDLKSGLVLTPSFGDLCDFTEIPKIGHDDVSAECHFDGDDADQISRFLKTLGGYQYADGYLKDKEGVADFMLMQVIGNEVLSIKTESHPVYALMSSVVGAKIVAASLNPMVKYADVNTLKYLLSEVTSIGSI